MTQTNPPRPAASEAPSPSRHEAPGRRGPIPAGNGLEALHGPGRAHRAARGAVHVAVPCASTESGVPTVVAAEILGGGGVASIAPDGEASIVRLARAGKPSVTA